MKTSSDFEKCAARLKALADPERLRIVQCLFEGERNVSQIATFLRDDVVNVSHHLSVLRHASIVATERKGRFISYRLHPDVADMARQESSGQQIDLGCCCFTLRE
jgi:DNA-binding transcriptional ArsR family regulator